MSTLVTVITPTKNRLPLLREAMESVQRQTLEEWEHIVVDDGSDDGTAEEVARRAAIDSRLRYVQRVGDKGGANACRNLGVRESRAELIVFLDSDDLLDCDCLRRRVEVLERNRDLDFAVFPGAVFTEIVGDRGRLFSPVVLGSDLDRMLYFDHPWEITSPIWRRSALRTIGMFDEDLLSWQDVDLHVRALIMGMKYLKFDTPDHHIRWNHESTKTSVRQFDSADHLDQGVEIVRSFRDRLEDAGLLNWSRRRSLAGLIFLLAQRWTRNGSLASGLRTWRSAREMALAPAHLRWLGSLILMAYRLKLLPPDYNERVVERFKCAVRFVE